MFSGKLALSPRFVRFLFFAFFFTVIIASAQSSVLIVPLLDVLQTFLAWPSTFEACLASFCIWACRHVQTILGKQAFVVYLIYQGVAYFIPVFIIFSLIGFHHKISIFSFIPYSMYAFVFWRFPAVMFANPVTDKLTVLLAIFLMVIVRFPWSAVTICSTIIGYYLWSKDVFRLRRSLLN